MVPQEKIYSITTSSWKLYYEFHGWEVRIKATGQSVSFSDRLLNANSRTHRTVGAAYIWLQYEADGYMDLQRNGKLLEELLQVMFSSQHTHHHQIQFLKITVLGFLRTDQRIHSDKVDEDMSTRIRQGNDRQ